MTDQENTALTLIKQTVKKWQDDKVSRLAAALAYFAVLSLPSILVLAVLVSGQLVGLQDAQQTLLNQAGRVMGGDGRAAVRVLLEAADRPQGAGTAAFVSILVLFFGASGVFVQLQDAMNTIYGVEADPDQGILLTVRKRLASFLIVAALGLSLAAIIIINSLVGLLGQTLSGALPGSIIWVRILNFVVFFCLLTLIIAVIFKVIPDVRVDWRDAAVGALATAVLFMLGIKALGLYFQYADPTSSYGAAGSLIMLLIWVYYSAQILFLGAEFTETYANRFGRQFAVEDDAVWTEGAQV